MNAADLEPMTRRLLEATRSLTTAFAQWSMGKASENDVSDSYVKLGNEYVVARNRLVQSGLGTSDIPDVPTELRRILEQALAQEPSKAVHAEYEPRVKAVMAHLFKALKLKQLQLAPTQGSPNLQQPPPPNAAGQVYPQAYPRPHNHRPAVPPPAPPPPDQHAAARRPVPPHSMPAHNAHAGPHAGAHAGDSAARATSQRTNNGTAVQSAPFRPAQAPVRAPNYRPSPHPPYDPLPAGGEPRQRLGVPGDALSQLQNHGALERQASKRYSSHQLAQIINGSPSEKMALPTTAVHKSSTAPDFVAHNVVRRPEAQGSDLPPQTPEQSIHRRMSMRQRQSSLPSSSRNSSTHNSKTSQELAVESPDPALPPQLPVFLRLGARVRKVMLDKPPSLGAIRLKFMDEFDYIHSGTNTFPEIIIRDERSGLEHELSESTVGDVAEGTLLTLQVKSDEEQTIQSELAAMRETMKELMTKLDSRPAGPSTKSAPGNAQGRSYPSPVLTGDGRFKLDKPMAKPMHREVTPDRVEQLQKEISSIKQTASRTVLAMQSEIAALRGELSNLRDAKVTSDVSYITDMKAKLDSETQRLIVRTEDISDIIDHQRVNVADRGVFYTPQELNNVRRELDSLASEFTDIETFVRSEKPVLAKTWEASLNNIISSQEWFKEQEALVRDLRHDIDQCLSVVDLVREANEKQRQRQQEHPQLRQLPPTLPPPLTKDEEQAATTAVLAEITALNLDHDQRVEAMKRAERLRRTELALRPDEFADELSQFVSDSKLKMNGGFEELERQVRDREQKARADGEKSEAEAKLRLEAIKEQRRIERQNRTKEEPA